MKGFEARIGETLDGFDASSYENPHEIINDLKDIFREKDKYRVFATEVNYNPDDFYDEGDSRVSTGTLEENTVGEIHGMLEDREEGFKLKIREKRSHGFRVDSDASKYELGIEPAEYVEKVESDLPDVMNPKFL
jgi:hypothetical protein